jgi:hypothetical protein
MALHTSGKQVLSCRQWPQMTNAMVAQGKARPSGLCAHPWICRPPLPPWSGIMPCHAASPPLHASSAAQPTMPTRHPQEQQQAASALRTLVLGHNGLRPPPYWATTLSLSPSPCSACCVVVNGAAVSGTACLTCPRRGALRAAIVLYLTPGYLAPAHTAPWLPTPRRHSSARMHSVTSPTSLPSASDERAAGPGAGGAIATPATLLNLKQPSPLTSPSADSNQWRAWYKMPVPPQCLTQQHSPAHAAPHAGGSPVQSVPPLDIR